MRPKHQGHTFSIGKGRDVVMSKDVGRAPSGRALVASDQAAARLDPSGFDPSRVRVRTARDEMRRVAERFLRQHQRDLDSPAYWDRDKGGRTKRQIYEGLVALDVETCTLDDVVAAGLSSSWVTEDCDICNRTQKLWFEIGEEPDYEARYLDLCAPCIVSLAAFASGMEARRAAAENTDAVHDSPTAAGGDAHTPSTSAVKKGR